MIEPRNSGVARVTEIAEKVAELACSEAARSVHSLMTQTAVEPEYSEAARLTETATTEAQVPR